MVILEHPMMHIKVQAHQPFGPRKEDFLRFLPYMGMAAISPFEQTFVPHPTEASYEI